MADLSLLTEHAAQLWQVTHSCVNYHTNVADGIQRPVNSDIYSVIQLRQMSASCGRCKHTVIEHVQLWQMSANSDNI